MNTFIRRPTHLYRRVVVVFDSSQQHQTALKNSSSPFIVKLENKRKHSSMDNAHQDQPLALSGGENAAASLVQPVPVQQASLVNHQGTNQLSGFVKPKVVFQRTDHKAKAACINKQRQRKLPQRLP